MKKLLACYLLLAYGTAAQSLEIQAKKAFANKQYEQAILLYEQLIAERTEQKNTDSILCLYNKINVVLSEMKDRPRFLKYEKALKTYLRPNQPCALATLSNLITAYKNTGRYSKASRLIEYAKAFEKNAPLLDLGIFYNNQATFSERMGDFKKTELYYLKAIDCYERDTSKIALNYKIVLMVNLSGHFLLTKQFDLAEKKYKEAIVAAQILERKYPEIKYKNRYLIYSSLAYLYYQDKKPDLAKQHIQKAFTLLEKDDVSAKWVMVAHYAGMIERSLGNYAKSHELLNRSLKTYQDLELVREEILAHTNIAETFFAQGNFVQTETALNQALNVFTKNPNYKREALDALHLYLRCALGQYRASGNKQFLARGLAKAHVLAQTIDLMRREHSREESKLFWRENVRPMLQAAIEISFLLQKPAEAFFFMEKSRAILLLDGMNALHAQKQLSPQQQEQENSLKQHIVGLQSKFRKNLLPSQKDSLNKLLEQAIETHETFIKALEKSNPAYYKLKYSRDFVTLANLQTHLHAQQQNFVEYFLADSSVFVLLVTSQKTVLKQLPAKNYPKRIRDLLQLCSYQQNTVSYQQAYIPLAFGLYQDLLAPLQMPAGRVVVSFDGQFFPFDALLDKPDFSAFLLKKYAFSYAYSANTLLTKSENKADKAFLGLAPVEFNLLKNKPLLGSDAVLEQMNQHIKGDLLLHQNATKKNFMERASAYKVLQLFSHAQADTVQENTRIYFQDADLSLPEIYAMQPLQAEMVVLSACETGVGQISTGEGVMSLARGFAFLGVLSTITTLWSVGDKSTYEITKLFYEFLRAGNPKDLALQKAKLAWYDQDSDNNIPYQWAALTVVGNTEPINLNNSYFWYWLSGFVGLAGIVTAYLKYRSSTN